MNKIILWFFSILNLLIFLSYPSSAHNVNADCNSFSQHNACRSGELIDGGVYFIRSKVDNSKTFDITNGNYSNGTEIISYTFLGWENQRFILEKSYGASYRIKPLNCNGLYLAVYDDNSNSGNKIVLRQEGAYDFCSLRTDRFVFEYNAVNDSYRISTYVSGNGKFLCIENYSLQNNAKIIQNDFDVNNSLYFEWILQKTETMQVNVNRTEHYNSGQTRWFYLNLPYSMTYCVHVLADSVGASVSLHEDDSTSTLIAQYDTIYSPNQDEVNFEYYATAFQIKKLKIRNYSSYSGNISFYVYPKHSFAVTTMYDYGINNIDSATGPLSSVQYMANIGLYPYFQVNMGRDNILQLGKNGKKLINSDYYFDIHHGNPGGTSFFDYLPGQDVSWIDIVNMPSFSGTNLAFWGSCNSATTSSNHNNSGITSNLALRSVELGSLYGVGFEGDVVSIALQYFLTRLLYHIGNSEGIFNSILNTSSETNLQYVIPLFFVPALKTPIVYVRSLNNQILKYNGNTGELIQRNNATPNDTIDIIIKNNVCSNLTNNESNKQLFEEYFNKYLHLFEYNKKYCLLFDRDGCTPFECYFDNTRQTLICHDLLHNCYLNENSFVEIAKIWK